MWGVLTGVIAALGAAFLAAIVLLSAFQGVIDALG